MSEICASALRPPACSGRERPGASGGGPRFSIMPWAAGSGTDAGRRSQIAQMLERDLKQPVNVVNRTGGSAWSATRRWRRAAPDGYTFGLITLEIDLMHSVGLTDLAFEKILAGSAGQPGPRRDVHVEAGLAPQERQGAVRDIKSEPDEVVASGTGQGGSSHVALAGLMQADGVTATRSAGCRPPGLRPR